MSERTVNAAVNRTIPINTTMMCQNTLRLLFFSTVGPCGLAMFCVVFDINWAIVRNEWLFGAFVGVAWHCRALYGVDGRSMALWDAVVRLKFNSLQEPQQPHKPQAPSEPK